MPLDVVQDPPDPRTVHAPSPLAKPSVNRTVEQEPELLNVIGTLGVLVPSAGPFAMKIFALSV
jgi:hypothetical protein